MTLEFGNASRDHIGEYACVVKGHGGLVRARRSIFIYVGKQVDTDGLAGMSVVSPHTLLLCIRSG